MKRDLACSNQLDRPRIVKKRCFFYLPGYELISSAGVHRRFATELERFRSTWRAAATMSPPKPAQDGLVSWRIESRGPNWRVDTDVTLLDWSDVLFADFSQPPWRIVSCGLAAMLDFFLSGTIIGYLRTNWRYLLFYVYPIFLLCTFCATGFVVAWLVIAHGILWPSALGPLLGVFCVALLVRWSGRRLHLYYALLDWRFAVSIVRRSRPEFEEKLDRFARTFAEIARASTADEIVIFGHSLGAVMMIQIMARALRHDPMLTQCVKRINLVSAGSSLLKIGLHPKAEHFRAAVRETIAEPAIYWIDFQALVDIFNFYKTDPVSAMGIPACGKPIVKVARIRNMVTDPHYRRMRWNPLRLHLQFISGNERRYFYDFFMICCGPMPLQGVPRRRPRCTDPSVHPGRLLFAGVLAVVV